MVLSLSYLEGISKEQIDIRPHALERDEIAEEWLYNSLLNGKILAISQQREYRFRIHYEHPTKREKYDLILVIDVIKNSTTCIKVVTTYVQAVKRRVR